jgi:hypothetical protein
MSGNGVVMLKSSTKSSAKSSGMYSIELTPSYLEYRVNRDSLITIINLDFESAEVHVNHQPIPDGIDKIVSILSTLNSDLKKKKIQFFRRKT